MVFKKSLIALSLLALPLTASADWLVGAGYGNISDDEDGVDLSLGVIYGSVAYEFSNDNSPFTFMPELRLGTGVSDDNFSGFDIEINSFTALSVRGQFNYDNGVYLFAMPSYANLDLEVSFHGESASDDSWEFGFGGGVGAKISDTMDIEASYESYDGTDVLSLGLKYAF